MDITDTTMRKSRTIKPTIPFAAALVLCSGVHAGHCKGQSCSAPSWIFSGPAAYYNRGDEPKITSAGAIQQAVAAEDGNAWLVGTVNGGVWKTSNLNASEPAWINVFDHQPVACSSISAMHTSRTNLRRVYAGCGGSSSSEMGFDHNVVNSGDWSGVMVSDDAGESWRMTGFPVNFYVTSVLEVAPGTILVSAQSRLYNASMGGIWRSKDDGSTWTLVSPHSTFNLLAVNATTVLATHARLSANSVSISQNSGLTWQEYSGGLDWQGYTPFYTCATLLSDGRTAVVAGLSVNPTDPTVTSSGIWTRRLDEAGASWRRLAQPTNLDEDAMPKDRMALLGDPLEPALLYVAGNAGALAWRVNVSSGVWTKLCRFVHSEARARLSATSPMSEFPHGRGRRHQRQRGAARRLSELRAGYVSPRAPSGCAPSSTPPLLPGQNTLERRVAHALRDSRRSDSVWCAPPLQVGSRAGAFGSRQRWRHLCAPGAARPRLVDGLC